MVGTDNESMSDLDSGQNPRRHGSRRQTRIDERYDAQVRRDGAIRRVARMRRGAIAGAAGLTAALSGLVASVAPGKSHSSTPTEGNAASGRVARPVDATAALPPLATAHELGLKAAPVAPASAPVAPASAPTPAPVAPASAPVAAPAPAPAVQAPAQPTAVSGGS
jgi:hypothetical protein